MKFKQRSTKLLYLKYAGWKNVIWNKFCTVVPHIVCPWSDTFLSFYFFQRWNFKFQGFRSGGTFNVGVKENEVIVSIQLDFFGQHILQQKTSGARDGGARGVVGWGCSNKSRSRYIFAGARRAWPQSSSGSRGFAFPDRASSTCQRLWLQP